MLQLLGHSEIYENLRVIVSQRLNFDRLKRDVVAINFEVWLLTQKIFYQFVLHVEKRRLAAIRSRPAVFGCFTAKDYDLEVVL